MPSLLSAGSNAQGQLGNGTTVDSHSFQRCTFLGCEPGALPQATSRIISLACGGNHTIALLETSDASSHQFIRELWGCGSGLKGQLGPAFRPPTLPEGISSVFRPIVLSLGQYGLTEFSCKRVCASWETTYLVLTTPGKRDVIVSMGADDFGDLGIGGNTKEKEKPFHVVSFDHIQFSGLNLRSDTIVVLDMAAGQHHTVAFLQATLADNTIQSFLVGWGTSRHGQLGDIPSNAKQGSAQPFFSQPKLVDISGNLKGLALGAQHTIVFHESMHLSGIGSNKKDQLSGLRSLGSVRCAACTWNGTYAIVDDHAGKWCIVSSGSNSHGQLGRMVLNDASTGVAGSIEFPETVDTRTLKKIACGSEHVLCLLSAYRGNTEIWGWGWNEHGNLGLGTTEDVQAPVKISPQPNIALKITDLWAGCGTSWLYSTD